MESLAFTILYKTAKSHNYALKLNKESTAVHCQFKQLDQLIRKRLKKEGKRRDSMGKRFKKKKASAHVYNLMTRNMTSELIRT